MSMLKDNMNKIKSIACGLFVVAALLVSAPLAHAQFDDSSDLGSFYGDGGGCCSYDSSPSYIDTYTDYGSAYSGSYGSSYPYSYSTPGYGGSYSMPSFYGGASTGYSTPSFYGATPAFYGASTPSNTWDNGNIYAPTNTWDNGNTYTYAPTTDSYNTTTNTNTCIYPGSCSVDDHSVVNANTTISSPTNITVTNPPASQTQIVYNTPQPYYAQPTYYSNPTPVYQPTYYSQPATPVYRNSNTPYITLSQVPYTGLELGPIGQVIYWSFLVLFSLFGAYLIVVKRAHTAVARGLKSALFGSDEHTTGAHEVVEQHTHEEVIETPAPANTDTTDEFILSQINRARA